MISMKNDPKSEKEGQDACCTNGEQPLYPYGLSLSLCDESMKKLGLSFDKLAIGQKLNLSAIVEVTSVSAYKEQEGTEASACLQITDMELQAAADKTREQDMYSNSKMAP
jgi:hypothetical protein